MKKIKIGRVENFTIIKGDVNLLYDNEILVTKDEDYTLLRKKIKGKVETFVIVPLKDFLINNDKG